MSQNWTCPYCDRAQVTTSSNSDTVAGYFSTGDPAHRLGLQAWAILCANPSCKKTTIHTTIRPWLSGTHSIVPNMKAAALFERRLLPDGSSKSFPEYVPKAIRDDYREACLIRDLSPKASATLSRRCLQGMIRDFGKVKAATLYKEISALAAAVEDGTAPRGVSSDSIDALTGVRKVGNIGAHMEAEIDVIVDVEPEEAQTLIELIEGLLDDWYVESHKRQQRFAKTIALKDKKEVQINEAKALRSTPASVVAAPAAATPILKTEG